MARCCDNTSPSGARRRHPQGVMPADRRIAERRRMRCRRLTVVTIGALLVVPAVASCSSDKAPVCSSIDDLKGSVQNLRDVNVEQGAVAEIKTDVAQVQSDFQTVKSDAKDQFSAQITQLSSALVASSNSANAAAAAPSVSAVAGLAVSLTTVSNATKALSSAVADTC